MKSNLLMKGYWALFIAVILTSTSCASHKKMIYLQSSEKGISSQSLSTDYELTIQPDDQLAISISSKHKELVAPFNTQVLIGSGGGNESYNSSQSNLQTGLAYFQVDKSGNINFPILGPQHVLGMTCSEIASSLAQQMKDGDHIKDALVTVKLMSFKVTVLGEVQKPGTINVSGERLTILEALGQAGDLLPSGLRQNIKVLREENGRRNTYFVDLTSHEKLTTSPVYYLQQNDVIYVEPNKSIGVRGSSALQTVSSFTGIASMLLAVLSLIITITN